MLHVYVHFTKGKDITIAWYMSVLVHVYPVKFSPASISIIVEDIKVTMASTAMPASGFASYHVFALLLARKHTHYWLNGWHRKEQVTQFTRQVQICLSLFDWFEKALQAAFFEGYYCVCVPLMALWLQCLFMVSGKSECFIYHSYRVVYGTWVFLKYTI